MPLPQLDVPETGPLRYPDRKSENRRDKKPMNGSHLFVRLGGIKPKDSPHLAIPETRPLRHPDREIENRRDRKPMNGSHHFVRLGGTKPILFDSPQDMQSQNVRKPTSEHLKARLLLIEPKRESAQKQKDGIVSNYRLHRAMNTVLPRIRNMLTGQGLLRGTTHRWRAQAATAKEELSKTKMQIDKDLHQKKAELTKVNTTLEYLDILRLEEIQLGQLEAYSHAQFKELRGTSKGDNELEVYAKDQP